MSVSVVQNTTTGALPASLFLSSFRKSMPFISGMFQSSRMTSGIRFWQAAMACRPSAASSTAKFSDSRMRLATRRMTRESSTTRHDFMERSELSAPASAAAPYRSLRRGRSLERQQIGDIEAQQQIAVEPVDALAKALPRRIQRRRVALERVGIDLQHLADRIDDQAVELAAVFDDDVHAGLVVRAVGQPEPTAHIDRGDDAAAQVECPRDLARGERNAGDLLRLQRVLDQQDRNAEQLAVDRHGDEFGLARLAARVGDGQSLIACLAHAAPLWSSKVSESVCSRAARSNLPT